MRHRLIPNEERRRMHREYISRALVVLACMISAAILVGAAALFPADIRARLAAKTATLSGDLARNSIGSAELSAAEAELSEARSLLTALSPSGSGGDGRFSAVVREIAAGRFPVQISSMALVRQGTSTLSMTIEGVAPTRSSLLAWKTRLESMSLGTTVDLPIATLARSVNVPFTMRITRQLP